MKVFNALLLSCFFCITTLKAETPKKPAEVLSLSSAMVDHLFWISEEQMRLIAPEKGTWASIDYPTLCSLLNKNPNISRMFPGGSGVNVIKGLVQLNHCGAILGKIGSDEKGEFFLNSLRKLGIDAYLQEEKLPTGQAICFITPDGEQTFRSYLGASYNLTEMQLDDSLFEGITIFHVEGYQLVDRDLVLRTLNKAKKAGVKISLSLANHKIVQSNHEFLLEVLPEYIDFIFCNQAEARELTGLPPKEACTSLASLCEVAVVTMGERGCWTQSGTSLFYTPSFAVKAVDTTGAGELFISGFLHGILTHEPLQKCAWLGSLVASYIVQVAGSQIPDHMWEEIHKRIEKEDPFKTCLQSHEEDLPDQMTG